MAIITGNHVYTCDTLAHFKDWAQFVSDSLVANGFARTGDAGQVNWGAIGAVPDETAPAWEIMTDADALHGTFPIYIRLAYSRVGAAGGSIPCMKIQGGTGTNGSGTLTGGVGSLITVVNTGVTPSGTAVPCYVVGDTGKFAVLMWRDVGNTIVPCVMWLDRSRNSSGAATASYFSYGGNATNTSSANACVVTSGKQFTYSWSNSSLGRGGATSLAYGGNTTILPVFPMHGAVGNPILSLVGAKSGDISEAVATTVSIYGSNHTYLFTKISDTGYNGVSGTAVGIIYE